MSGAAVGTHLALLRGVNVGGKNKLPMRDLAAMFTAAGCGDVRTLIQSGNVVFTAKSSVAERVGAVIASEIATQFGYRTPVILRTEQQLRDVVSNNPYLQAGVAEDWLHVMFLQDTPEPGKAAELDPNRSAPDVFTVRGADIYLHVPNGMADTKLTNAWFDSRLKTVSTARNWRTINKLLAMMDE